MLVDDAKVDPFRRLEPHPYVEVSVFQSRDDIFTEFRLIVAAEDRKLLIECVRCPRRVAVRLVGYDRGRIIRSDDYAHRPGE